MNRNIGGGTEAAKAYSHDEEMTRIDEIGRMLKSTQQRLNKASSKLKRCSSKPMMSLSFSF